MEVKERGKVFAYCGILFLMLGMALLVLFGGDVLAWASSHGTYTPYANLTFAKTWLDEDGNTASPPENTEVTFTVTLETESGSQKELEITLNKGNNWSYNLLDNRKAIEDEYGIDVADYYYKGGNISEIKVHGYTYDGAEVSALPDRFDGVNHMVYKNYTITLKNEKEPAPTPEPSSSTKPSPAPSTEPTPGPSTEPAPAPPPAPTPAPATEPTPVPTTEPTAAPSTEPTAAVTPTPAPEQPATDAPKTGDETNLAGWIMLAAAGAASLTAALVRRTRRRSADKR